MDEKSPKGATKNRGNFRYADLIGFLLKAGQGDEITLGEWWGMKNLTRYQVWSDIKGGRFSLN